MKNVDFAVTAAIAMVLEDLTISQVGQSSNKMHFTKDLHALLPPGQLMVWNFKWVRDKSNFMLQSNKITNIISKDFENIYSKKFETFFLFSESKYYDISSQRRTENCASDF